MTDLIVDELPAAACEPPWKRIPRGGYFSTVPSLMRLALKNCGAIWASQIGSAAVTHYMYSFEVMISSW